MLEPSGELNLPLEPLGTQCFGDVGAEDLDDDFPSQRRVVGDEDAGHPAGTQLAVERVAAGESAFELIAEIGCHLTAPRRLRLDRTFPASF
jgi:hypothetical protein